jgi:hypothetical protein
VTSRFSRTAIALSAAIALFTGCAQLKTQTGDAPTASSQSNAPPATIAQRITWMPGAPHPNAPNVIASQLEGEWQPAAGYQFSDKSRLAVIWVPGLPHPDVPNVVSSLNEGKWTPDDGFDWVDPADSSFDVRWSPGKQHSKFNNVIAADAIQTWGPAPGYVWIQPDLTVVRAVRWAPGTDHPSAPNVIAGAAEGTWNAASGFEWVDPRAISLEVRRQIYTQSTAATDGRDWAGHMVKAFERLGANVDGIKRKADRYTSPRMWRWSSNLRVGASGATACAIPFVGVAALPIEFLDLMSEMYDSSLGMGFVVAGTASRSDFANILAVWTDELSLDDDTLRVAYDVAEHVAHEIGQQVLEQALDSAVDSTMKRFQAKSTSGQPVPPPSGLSHVRAPAPFASNVLAHKASVKAGGKLGTKIAVKAGTKMSGKYVAKFGAAAIPVPGASAAGCAIVNGLIMDSLLDAAELYYRKTAAYRLRRYGQSSTR